MIWICAIYYLTWSLGSVKLLKKIRNKCPCFKFGEKDHEESIKIDDYWRCLDDDDREWTKMEERNSRDQLNIATMYESAMQALNQNRMGRCHLTGIHTYDILRNPTYWQSFQYISAAIPERYKFIKDGDGDDSNNPDQSDFVRRILNLSFLPPDELKELWDIDWDIKAVRSRDFLPSEVAIKPSKLMNTKDQQKLKAAGKLVKAGASKAASAAKEHVKRGGHGGGGGGGWLDDLF